MSKSITVSAGAAGGGAAFAAFASFACFASFTSEAERNRSGGRVEDGVEDGVEAARGRRPNESARASRKMEGGSLSVLASGGAAAPVPWTWMACRRRHSHQIEPKV